MQLSWTISQVSDPWWHMNKLNSPRTGTMHFRFPQRPLKCKSLKVTDTDTNIQLSWYFYWVNHPALWIFILLKHGTNAVVQPLGCTPTVLSLTTSANIHYTTTSYCAYPHMIHMNTYKHVFTNIHSLPPHNHTQACTCAQVYHTVTFIMHWKCLV